MRGARAKAIRKAIYGGAPTNAKARKHAWLKTGQVIDRPRVVYQGAKRGWRRHDPEARRALLSRARMVGP